MMKYIRLLFMTAALTVLETLPVVQAINRLDVPVLFNFEWDGWANFDGSWHTSLYHDLPDGKKYDGRYYIPPHRAIKSNADIGYLKKRYDFWVMNPNGTFPEQPTHSLTLPGRGLGLDRTVTIETDENNKIQIRDVEGLEDVKTGMS